MGKGKKVNSKSNLAESTAGGGSTTSNSNNQNRRTPANSMESVIPTTIRRSVLYENSIYWIIGCVILGWILGYTIGSGWTGLSGDTVSPWRTVKGVGTRQSTVYQLVTLQFPWRAFVQKQWQRISKKTTTTHGGDPEINLDFEKDPTHPFTWGLLREAVIREDGGYVYPDLGILSPAPSGAIRGLGMVDDAYMNCQMRCMPGNRNDKMDYVRKIQECHESGNGGSACLNINPASPPDGKQLYKQEEMLLRIPLAYQMTRSVAIDTLSAFIPTEVQTKAEFQVLDDAAMLVLLLAHERGVGKLSRWYPYILSLPHEPSCGYSPSLRPHLLDALEALRIEVGVDVEGWPAELVKASIYADRIANGLFNDYGKYIKTPEGVSVLDNIKWALCQVASRATAGNDEHGSLRLVPILDLVNHDINAGGFTELTGQESFANGDFLNATEDDVGAFVIRSLRHGRRRPLRKGQELMANYNVPLYTPLDWFVSLGFVPPERWGPWEKVDPVLPRVREDGPFGEKDTETSRERWEREGPGVLNRIKEMESKY